MYEITHEGETVRLSDEAYGRLLRRFDPDRYRKYDRYFETISRCICDMSSGTGGLCGSCPLKQTEYGSCVELLRRLSGYQRCAILLSRSMVRVFSKDLVGIRKVHDILLTAKKVAEVSSDE